VDFTIKKLNLKKLKILKIYGVAFLGHVTILCDDT
jgi:hypothetical protein